MSKQEVGMTRPLLFVRLCSCPAPLGGGGVFLSTPQLLVPLWPQLPLLRSSCFCMFLSLFGFSLRRGSS